MSGARLWRLVLAVTLGLLLSASANAQAPVPTPEAGLGFAPGTDGKLAGWTRLLAYYEKLAAASPRVVLEELGKSTDGRRMVALLISSRANIAAREAHRKRLARLADPRRVPADETEALLDDARLSVLIACGLHSSECASTLTAPVLAHHLATDESRATKLIRSEVIVVLLPSVNPDGTDIVKTWYDKVRGTPFEASGMPHLYQRYCGHDNNRDWYMLTQAESRNVTRLMYRRWFPQIVLDLHEMGNKGARFFLPPFVDPVAPNVDPILLRQIDLLGNHMAYDLARAGKTGVAQGVIFDAWWNGGMRNTPWRHNVVGILTEAAKVRFASPVYFKPAELKGHGRGMPDQQRRYNFADPWPGGWWRIRDIIDYQRISSLSLLKLSAKLRRTFLSGYLQLGRRAIHAGKSGPPFAFVISGQQHDPAAAQRLVRVLRLGGVEVHRAAAAFVADGVSYPEGSWVVSMAQPYRAHAKSLLEPQRYPELRTTPDGQPVRPYDISGWTLPLQMGVDCREIVRPFLVALDRSGRPTAEPARKDPGAAAAYAFSCRDSGSYRIVNRLVAAGVRVHWLPAALGQAAAGDFVVPDDPDHDRLWTALRDAAAGTAVRFVPLGAAEAGRDAVRAKLAKLRRPVRSRVALYRPFTANIDEGWTRWTLEQAAFDVKSVDNARVRAGSLAEAFDVLVLPDMSAARLEHGAKDKLPAPYAGGLGREGLEALREFVRRGGRLICLSRSSDLAIRLFKLDIDNLRSPAMKARAKGAEKAQIDAFSCPGSILRVTVDTADPIGHGDRATSALMFARCPIFVAREGKVVASYPGDEPLLSGWLAGGELLYGKAAVLRVDRGLGDIVLFGCRPQFRGQPQRTFKWLYNAILKR